MDFQGFTEPFFGFGVTAAVLADHAQAVVVVGDGLLVFPTLDDRQGLGVEIVGFFQLPAVLGYLAHLMEDRSGAGVGLAVFLVRQVLKELLVQDVGPVELLGLDAFASLGTHQVQPKLDATRLLGFLGGDACCFQQLTAEAAQLGIALLHPEDLGQRLDQQLGVLPLASLQRQGQRLGDVALFSKDGGGAGVLVLVEGFHEIVGGVGVDSDDLVFQLLDGALGELPVEAAAQKPGKRGVYLVDAWGDRFQEPAGPCGPEQSPAGAVTKLFAGHRAVGLAFSSDVGQDVHHDPAAEHREEGQVGPAPVGHACKCVVHDYCQV